MRHINSDFSHTHKKATTTSATLSEPSPENIPSKRDSSDVSNTYKANDHPRHHPFIHSSQFPSVSSDQKLSGQSSISMVVLVLDVPIVECGAMAAALSILLVLFMVAPLGSIYVFLISLHHHPDHHSSSTSNEETAALIMDLLQKNGMAGESTNGTTAALDELWSTINANPALAELLTQRTLQHHIRLVMPWLVTFALAASIMVVMFGTAMMTTARRRPRRQERIRKIVATALDCQVVLQTTTTTDDDDDNRGNSRILRQRPRPTRRGG
jgi:hypothetical protein